MAKLIIPDGDNEWTNEKLVAIDGEIRRIAEEELQLDYYPLNIEIITSEQMLDAYASVGMPVSYDHWSFGKRFLQNERQYKQGHMGLAYEIVINSNPCIAYCMEDNTMAMQALVIAHAGYGHNAFFKNNYLFKQWTHADAIIDYLTFAKKYIAECEEKYGIEKVEDWLDACHALQNYGVDRYKHANPLSLKEEDLRQREREEYLQQQLNVLWRTLPNAGRSKGKEPQSLCDKPFPEEPQENILYFIEKHAPELPTWKREIIRIVRMTAQYFFPQRQTQVMNEGFATFTHYYIMNRLHEKGIIGDGAMKEFIHSHTNVTYQPDFDETRTVLAGKDPRTGEPIYRQVPIYSGINPYALGFHMYMDIKRICEKPDNEDREWFSEIAGSNWLEQIKFASETFRDESFIRQYLSPHAMRYFRMFSILDDDELDKLYVTGIHSADVCHDGYRRVREVLGSQYDLSRHFPDIEVVNVNKRGDRTLTLRHTVERRRPLHENDTIQTLQYAEQLWEFPVNLEVEEDGKSNLVYRVQDGELIEDEDELSELGQLILNAK